MSGVVEGLSVSFPHSPLPGMTDVAELKTVPGSGQPKGRG